VVNAREHHGEARAAAPIPARAGIGLRFVHHRHVVDRHPQVAWFEVHAENYLGDGVAPDMLMRVRERYPVSVHATGLSLGSADGLDADHLATLAALCGRIEPGLVSDHLSWSAIDGVHLPDLLPVPMTHEALDLFAANLERAQVALGRVILIENPSVYCAFAGDEMSEADFLGALVRRCGCGLLLDINNVAVTAANLGEAALARLDAILGAVPAEAIGEIHLAGHAIRPLAGGGVARIDDHGSPVRPEVWDLFERATVRIGPRPALIEWDTNIPDFAVLRDEADRAQAILDRAEAPARRLALAAHG
jgi:uncharacterized protein (UPF0276 family)